MELVVRLAGEITLKSPAVRKRFVSQLIKNLKTACKKNEVEVTIKNLFGRMIVTSENEKVKEVCQRVFGIHSVSEVAEECEPTIEAMKEVALRLYKTAVEGKTFAMRVKRIGTHPFTSIDVEREVGGVLWTSSKGVRIKNPDIAFCIDIQHEKARFFLDTVSGSKGFPIGIGGRALVLVSGGFDSLVASWLVQKRGVSVDYLFLNLAGKAYERSVLEVVSKLTKNWSYGYEPNFYSFDLHDFLKDMKEKTNPKYRQVLLKRMFIRVASDLCEKIKASAIITGEALGQVSSQTIENLRSINESAKFPVLRPLVTSEKSEIMDLARRIGVYDECSRIHEFCSLDGGRPATKTRPKDLAQEEEQIANWLLPTDFEKIKKIELKNLNMSEMFDHYSYTSTIDSGHIVLDCRTEEEFSKWHYPQAIHREPYAFSNTSWLDKTKRYVIYCQFGTQSAMLAEQLQKAGFEAYSFLGGLDSIKKQEKENITNG